MYDNLKNVNNTCHINKKRFLLMLIYVSLHADICVSACREISVSVFLIYVTDVECVLFYFPALL